MLGHCRGLSDASKGASQARGYIGVLVCASLIGSHSDFKSAGGRHVLVFHRTMSYFGRIRRWHRVGSWGFVACDTHNSEFYVDGDRDCVDNVAQGDYVFFEAMIDENHKLNATHVRLALPHEVRAMLHEPDTQEARGVKRKLEFSSSGVEDNEEAPRGAFVVDALVATGAARSNCDP